MESGHSKTTRYSTNKLRKNARRHIRNVFSRKQNNFRAKYGNDKNISEKQNGLITWNKS